MFKVKSILLLSVMSANLGPTFGRWSTAPSPILVLYRMVITLVLQFPMILRNRSEFKFLNRRLLLLCLGSGVMLGLHFITFFESLKWTAIAASSVLVNLEVLFVALGTVVFFHKRLSGKAWIAILLTFFGSAVVAMGGTSVGVDPIRGNILAVVSGFMTAGYTLIGSMCRKDVSSMVYTALVYLAAGVTVLIVTVVSGMPLGGYGAINIAMAFCLAVFCTLLGHSVFTWSLRYLSAPVVAIFKMTGCVFSTMWGMLLFREFPDLQVYVGGGMVIAGIVLYNMVTHKEDTAEQSGTKQQ